MQTTSPNQRAEPPSIDPDAATEQAMLVHWQRRARAFAWACGVRLDRLVGRDED